MNLMSVAEAADKLGVSARQVRRLAAAGELPARRVADRWLLDAGAVLGRSRSEPQLGRPLSAQMAWSVIAAVDAALEEASPAIVELPVEDRRMRHRLRRLLADAPPAERWHQWLRHRAHAQQVWVHPGLINRLVQDDRLHAADARAVAASGVSAAGGDRHCFYADENVVESVLDDYRARPSDEGQVVLMVVPREVASVVLGSPGDRVPAAAALVDLLSSADARERHAAAAALASARQRLVAR